MSLIKQFQIKDIPVEQISGILPISKGGTGSTELASGYVKSLGNSLTTSLTISGSDISGDINGNAVGTSKILVTNDSTSNSTYYMVFANTVDGSTLNILYGDNNSNGPNYNPSTKTFSVQNSSTVSSSAKYADLAEKYISDKVYDVGTVLIFGGVNEVTISKVANDIKVAGVISNKPAFLMNKDLNSNNTIIMALRGRVFVKVVGVVKKGDILVSSNYPGYAMVNNNPLVGTIIGKSLVDKANDDFSLIEAVVGM